MPDISRFHGTIVTVHVLGVILFIVAHSVSAAVLLRIQFERDPARLRSLLNLSRRSVTLMGIGFLIWFLTGILAGFSGNWWTSGRWWIWVSLAVAMVITGVMTPYGRLYLDRVRRSVGLDANGAHDATVQVDGVALQAAIKSGRPWLIATIGLGGLAVLFWLMLAKPF